MLPLKEKIMSLAASQGATLVGVAPARVYTDYLDQVRVRLQETGAQGKDFRVGEDAIAFFERLSDVRRTMASARSIILLGVYSLDRQGDYSATRQRLQGKTARTYAYYPVVRQIAEQIADCIETAGHLAVQGQDIPLKFAANEMGLGTYGWNGLLLTRHFGSYVALRAVVTNADLEPDAFDPPVPPCQDCGRCLRACPTGALYAPYRVNPALCINPLTRKPGDIPTSLRSKMGQWVCGCDICQEVCPMNRDLMPRVPDPRAGFDPSHHASHQTLGGLAKCPDLKRLIETGPAGVMTRNAVIALANIGTAEAMEILRHYENIGTDELRRYVAWAMDCIKKNTKKHDPPNTGNTEV